MGVNLSTFKWSVTIFDWMGPFNAIYSIGKLYQWSTHIYIISSDGMLGEWEDCLFDSTSNRTL